MNKQEFISILTGYAAAAPGNRVPTELAIRPELAGLRLTDTPLVGFAAGDDPWFKELKKPGVIGEHFLLPGEWLPGAKTVISIFFPFSPEVKAANRIDMSWPAEAWLHARIEGQAFVFEVCSYLKARLEDAGFKSLVPSRESRFASSEKLIDGSGKPLFTDKSRQDYYTSNWSERHVAQVCGLGTFGLSRGLITQKGIAGRFGSLVTDACFEPDTRPYTRYDEYCTRCGACARNCPVGAISLSGGKWHPPCSEFLNRTEAKHAPRYGCGKCQVRVPCENGIPEKLA
jgi:epoxyqueuosine reductase QueG